MNDQKLKILFVLPYHHWSFIKFLPEFEPYAFIILGTLVKDLADVEVIDLRFEGTGALKKKLKALKPDIVGIRAHCAADTGSVLDISKIVRQYSPASMNLVGGQCCTLQPHDFTSPDVDVLCMGHGDQTFRELVEAKAFNKPLEDVDGLALVKNGKVEFTPPRKVHHGQLTWPKLDRSLLKKYEKKYDAQMTITSMGCPHRCKFCALWIIPEGAYLLRKPEEVVDDIASCSSDWVHFGDDNTFHNYNFALSVYQLIKERGIKKKLTAYARTDTITKYPDLFEKWASIGLKEIVVGYEAFKEAELKYINKRNSAECNRKANEILTRLGITSLAHFIVFPDYTAQDFKDLWRYIDTMNFSEPIFPPLTPLPGTETFNEMKKKDVFTIYDLGLFNLEYMVVKTKIPKWKWYSHYIWLWTKTVLPTTFWKRHKNAGWSWKSYLIRLGKLSSIMPKYLTLITRQLWIESRIAKKGKPKELAVTFQTDYESPFSKRVLEKRLPPLT